MPVIEDFIERHMKGRQLFHFTDRKNIASIKEHGLLSLSELERHGIAIPAPGGDALSQTLDKQKNLHGYVHLCMTGGHPMCFTAQQSGRITDPVYLMVKPNVMLEPGVLCSLAVSNANGVATYNLADGLPQMDVEALYSRLDWSNHSQWVRRNAVEKYEILVPTHVPLTVIKFPYGI